MKHAPDALPLRMAVLLAALLLVGLGWVLFGEEGVREPSGSWRPGAESPCSIARPADPFVPLTSRTRTTVPPSAEITRAMEAPTAFTAQDAPIVMVGFVRDEGGRPIANAELVACLVKADRSAPPYPGRGLVSQDLHTDSKGRFEVRSEAEVRRVRLSASHPHYQPVNEGTHGADTPVVELCMKPAGVLHGRVPLDPRVEATAFRVRLLARHGGSWTEEPKPDGSFTFSSVPPGSYTLTTQLQETREEVAREEGIVVGAWSAPGSDPVPLDLRKHWQIIELTVTDRVGEPVLGFGVSYPRRPGDFLRVLRDPTGRKCARRVFATRSPRDVVVFAKGYRTLHLDRLRGDEHLVLHRGPPLTMVLAEGSLPRQGFHLEVALVPEAGSSSLSSLRASFDGEGNARMVLAKPGGYSLRFRLVAGRPGVFGNCNGAGPPPPPSTELPEVRRRVVCLAGEEETVLEISLPPKALAAATQRLDAMVVEHRRQMAEWRREEERERRLRGED